MFIILVDRTQVLIEFILFISGLEISSADLDKAVLLKNRAAVYLKTKNYEQVVKVQS